LRKSAEIETSISITNIHLGKKMKITKTLPFAFVTLVFCASAACAQPTIIKAKPLKAETADTELMRLLKARYNERLSAALMMCEEWEGKPGLHFADAAGELMRAGLDVFERREDKIKLMEQILEVAEPHAQLLEKYEDKTRKYQGHRARALVLELQIELLKLKKTGKPKKTG
jgi:hypothetical protein